MDRIPLLDIPPMCSSALENNHFGKRMMQNLFLYRARPRAEALGVPCVLVGSVLLPPMDYSSICCCDGLFVIVTLTLFVCKMCDRVSPSLCPVDPTKERKVSEHNC
eukprot:scaffold12968_cov152-Skeletonema_marinoi.AAC.2